MYDHQETKDTAMSIQDRIVSLLEERHVGRDKAIKARDLAHQLDERERVVRAAIAQARKSGILILSAISPPYGYFVAANRKEWSEFRNSNLRARALDILETDQAMARAARKAFGEAVQLQMFDGAEVVA